MLDLVGATFLVLSGIVQSYGGEGIAVQLLIPVRAEFYSFHTDSFE